MPSLTWTLAYAPCIDTLGKKLRHYHSGATAEFDVLPIHLPPGISSNLFTKTLISMHQFYVRIIVIKAGEYPGTFEIHGETTIIANNKAVTCNVQAQFQEKLRGKHGTFTITWDE